MILTFDSTFVQNRPAQRGFRLRVDVVGRGSIFWILSLPICKIIYIPLLSFKILAWHVVHAYELVLTLGYSPYFVQLRPKMVTSAKPECDVVYSFTNMAHTYKYWYQWKHNFKKFLLIWKKLHSNQQWPPKNSDTTNLTRHFKGGSSS